MSEGRGRPLLRRGPWEIERWRDDLRGRGGVELTLAGERVRIVTEPLIRSDAERGPLQSIRVMGLPATLPASAISVTDEGGQPVPSLVEPGPRGSMRVLVPEVREGDERRRLRLGVTAAAGERAEADLALPAMRRWTVHLIHHSHFDIGYTDPQPIVIAQQVSFLDSALALMEATDDWPADARFRWCAESLWPVRQWAASRSRSRVAALIERARQGRLELSAMPFNLHTEACSTAELFELLRGAKELSEQWGLPLVSAMQTDVPGAVAGLPDALGEAGVRYLSVAHNWAGRAVPHLVGGADLPRLFRWRGAAGHEVLAWRTDTPHGLAYAEGALLGLSESFEAADDLLPAYLSALAAHPYPYAGGIFGWAAADVPVERAPYPFDLLHLRVTGRLSDNTAPRRIVAEVVRAWNEKWAWPHLRLSTNTDFFEAAEAELADHIPTFTGDWNDWWADGLGSGAQEMALQRESQALALDAATLGSMAAMLDAEPPSTETLESRRATYEELALFDEHTWGAADPWGDSDEGRSSGRRQWHWKVARALAAHDRSSSAAASALAGVAEQVARSRGALATIAVVNTCGWARTDIVSAFVPEAVVSLDVPLAVVDTRSGAVLAAAVEEPAFALNRDSGRVLRILVPEVPAVGFVRLEVVAAPERPSLARAFRLGRQRARGVAGSAALANGHFRLALDLERAGIASLVEVASGRELVSERTAFAFAGYVYDQFATASRFNHASSRLEVSERLELLGSRSIGAHAVVRQHTRDAVSERLTYELVPDGARSVTTTLTLPHEVPWLDISVRVAKDATERKESAYLTFPFDLPEPRVRVDVAGTVVGSGIESVPGGAAHMRAMREWVSLEAGGLSVAWATRDAPLVQLGGLSMPFAPFPPTVEPEPATIVSWIHNNVWDTNFPSSQAFDRAFRYRVAAAPTHGVASGAAAGAVLAQRTAASLSRPLLAVLARGHVDGEDANTAGGGVSLLEIEEPSVELVDVVADAAGAVLVRLRGTSDAPVRIGIRCALGVRRASRATFLGVAREPLEVRDGSVELEVPARGVAAARLELDDLGA